MRSDLPRVRIRRLLGLATLAAITLALKLTDEEGRLVRRQPRDVNPISYYFSNCQILDAPLAGG